MLSQPETARFIWQPANRPGNKHQSWAMLAFESCTNCRKAEEELQVLKFRGRDVKVERASRQAVSDNYLCIAYLALQAPLILNTISKVCTSAKHGWSWPNKCFDVGSSHAGIYFHTGGASHPRCQSHSRERRRSSRLCAGCCQALCGNWWLGRRRGGRSLPR